METRYYYRRVPEDKRASWIPCSKARAEKRQEAAFGQEKFLSFVVSFSETYPKIPDKGFVTIRELEIEEFEFEAPITITFNKALIFGGEEKEYRAQYALSVFCEAAADCVDFSCRQ